jgi:hypothetical protein
MRNSTDIQSLERFMIELGRLVKSSGRVYLVGGTTAILHGWRESTVDIDCKPEPEPEGFFEAIARLKDQLSINIELAAPDHFIPALPGWEARSEFIARHGQIDFYHYDYYSQALSKIERNHGKDKIDVDSMLERKLITIEKLQELFDEVESKMIRYPSLDPESIRNRILEWKNL